MKYSRLNESGRSMVEILGVLAIIGVLSIGGLTAYRSAINRQQANTIIDGMNKRVVIAIEEEAKGTEIDQWLSSFDPLIADRYHVRTDIYNNTSLSYYQVPIIETSDIPEGVCDVLKDSRFPPDYAALVNDSRPRVATCKQNIDGAGQNKLIFVLSEGVVDCEKDADCGTCKVCDTTTHLCKPKSCAVNKACDPSRNACYAICDETNVATRCGTGATAYCKNGFCATCGTGFQKTADQMGCECITKCSTAGSDKYYQDPNTCECKCRAEEGEDADTCECPEGMVFKDGKCSSFSCTPHTGDYGYFSCYSNGVRCAHTCRTSGEHASTPDNLKYDTCDGYCSDYCPAGTVYEHLSSANVNGCRRGKTSCYRYAGTRWYCYNDDVSEGSELCCISSSDSSKDGASSFGKCARGTCDRATCDAVGGSFVQTATNGRWWGCQISKSVKIEGNSVSETLYALPHDGNWEMSWTQTQNMVDSNAHCGVCTDADLKQPNGVDITKLSEKCRPCFNRDISCPKTKNKNEVELIGTWNPQTLLCEYNNFDGRKIVCNKLGRCYVGSVADANYCCYNSHVANPESCTAGRCSQYMPGWVKRNRPNTSIAGDCPAGTTFQKDPVGGATYHGCVQNTWTDCFPEGVTDNTQKRSEKCQNYLARRRETFSLFYMDGTASSDYSCWLVRKTETWASVAARNAGNAPSVSYSKWICGQRCDAGCTRCAQVSLPQCQGTTGTTVQKVCIQGQSVISTDNCVCDSLSHETNDHCCFNGQEYINGKCQLGCGTGQCLAFIESGYECKKEIESKFTRANSTDSSCMCVDDTKCYDLSYSGVCRPATGLVDVNGVNKRISKGSHGECVYSDVENEEPSNSG